MDESFDAFEIKPNSSIIEHFNNHPTCIDKEFNFILQKTELRALETDKFRSALEAKNKLKNRYSNVLPFEETRVKINIDDDDDDEDDNEDDIIVSNNNNNNNNNEKRIKRNSIGSSGQSDVMSNSSDEEDHGGSGDEGTTLSDYINASFINNGTYICTQGPLLNTIVDFWKMIWEQNSNIIVMLTREEENFKTKCDKYWPDKDEERYGNFIVKFDNNITIPDILIRREFTLENLKDNKTRKIYHFQYTTWPDHGTPVSTTGFLKFVSFVDHEKRSGPIVVHCSAGIGRSGTFVAIHSIVAKFAKHYDEKKQAPSINLPKLVVEMRNERPGMVQTRDQYRFCYLAISEAMNTVLKKEQKKRKGLSYSYSSIPLTGPEHD
ncbi:protein tyrosine phosphatase [Dictyostelium discoideum AX4]|uniref:Tyrosine-protein phosphatase 2 n=1 Tax=Dictyostelium discoideum TaxID=44689 RepID=PTP2_DICDI|nr:protein tyrosine phosphatase [Dictyostelium discoideum AX4]P34138.1 RecName: Full=Tyrosine-protein phosphatase 2; AltName: Full=Protein-tyrosine-phosphate phosphohydrolase 2; Short=PTPA [Dictyostelium discoideum]AAA33242.1 protein tyrosine phosphatase [Dictyostelium discoideum]EAL68105.1 protein tyrosine phosphatase [Dictyostelium discoideum AX4]prf//2016423A protein Tyr phosphatase PTP2 [Dictyostelium discoideum]|eukprot:XP_642173.1 protein tyrosine phosphatase [Dictyostelium discoideum AX4]